VPDETTTEMRDLLREIRDLLRPVADSYQDEYERRQAQREAERIAAIRALVVSSDKRSKAWGLADGTRTQRAIAKEAGMDEGGASRFFKSLRDLAAITDSPNPKQAVEVK
jgi:hypothetical protein